MLFLNENRIIYRIIILLIGNCHCTISKPLNCSHSDDERRLLNQVTSIAEPRSLVPVFVDSARFKQFFYPISTHRKHYICTLSLNLIIFLINFIKLCSTFECIKQAFVFIFNITARKIRPKDDYKMAVFPSKQNFFVIEIIVSLEKIYISVSL